MKHIIFCALLLLPSFLTADEIFLKEGKILQGKITKEDAREYTLTMRSNMILRVDKSKVEKVTRSAPRQPARNTIRMDSLKPAAVHGSTIAVHATTATLTTAPAAQTQAASAPAPQHVAEPKTGDQFQLIKKDMVTIERTSAVKTYAVEGSTMPQIERSIFHRKEGKGFMLGRERRASQTVLVSSWTGTADKDGAQSKWKAVVIQATVTTSLPAWKAGENAAPALVLEWNKFLQKTGAYATGMVEITHTSLESFAGKLAVLRAPTEAALRQESRALYEEMKDEIRKKQLGYDRRMKNYFDEGPK